MIRVMTWLEDFQRSLAGSFAGILQQNWPVVLLLVTLAAVFLYFASSRSDASLHVDLTADGGGDGGGGDGGGGD